MENSLDNNAIKKNFQNQLNMFIQNDERQINDLNSYLLNEKKQMDIMKNKIREKKYSINQMYHEIEANTVIMSELKESVLEEEKKLQKYPKLVDDINKQIEEIVRNYNSSKSEYKIIQMQEKYIKNEWKNKLETINKLLGFKINFENDKLIIEFTNIDENEPDKKYKASILLHNKMYEPFECVPHISNFENYVDYLNSGLSFTTFCCLLRKDFKVHK